AKLRLPDTEIFVEARPVKDSKQVLVYGARNTRSIDMDRMTSSISKRVNPGGQKEVTIRRMGNDRVEVIIPQAEPAEVELIKDKISTAGALQFRILANSRVHERIIKRAQAVEGHDSKVTNDKGEEEIEAQWIPLDPQQYSDGKLPPDAVVRHKKDGVEV